MIFLSAQPSDPYFKWQLRVQIQNLKDLNFQGEYHILVRYEGQFPIHYSDLINELKDSTQYKLFFYKDNRPKQIVEFYIPAIRPHIIKQHLKENPLESFFYMDSDVIYRELPDFDYMDQSTDSFCSDTIGYIGSEYLKSKSVDLFHELCKAVGVNPELIEKNQHNSGGAQYYLKGTTPELWDKIEKDCGTIYRLMKEWNKENVKPNQPHSDVQQWCADMWSVLWNCLGAGIQMTVIPDLNFCWATDPIDKWDKTKIMHNAGVGDKNNNNLFFKGAYIHADPIKLPNKITDSMEPKFCSYKYAEAIDKLR